VTQDGKILTLQKWADWDYPLSAEIKTGSGSSKIKITRLKRGERN
jgi:hypothetical protein